MAPATGLLTFSKARVQQMKLLTKTTIYFLLAMIPLLSVAGFYLFKQFSKKINFRSDKELLSEEVTWAQYLQNEADNGLSFILKTPDIFIAPTGQAASEAPAITDVNEFNTKEHHTVFYRQLSQIITVSGITYQIIIRQSQEQKAALVADITKTMLSVFAGLFAATLIFNWAISKRLWKPFGQSLKKIRNAELQKMENLHFEDTSTKEFNELNASLNFMAGKIYKDYVNMKEFTENAAHEMQTPVAIAQSKLELLLQDTNLKDEQVQSIMEAITALNRLKILHEGLLLLAKIENNQYSTTKEINLTKVTQKYLQLFNEFIKDKQLSVTVNYETDFIVKLHPTLADSLITNLLGNAIKYNLTGGSIRIDISATKYLISNTSSFDEIPKERLFKRMASSKQSGETSNGLGLAIVKKITEANNLHITYCVLDGWHQFEIEKL